MNVFIRSWFFDLHNRLEKMINHLENLSMTTRPSSEFKKMAVIGLTELKSKITSIINSKILEEDFFTPNAVIKYNLINYEFLTAEKFLYLPIKNYDEKAEGYFEKIIQSVYDEIGSSQLVPFISTISDSDLYYWTYSKFNIIAVPQGEEKHLLNLSDLYHEIGHLLFGQYKEFFVKGHDQKVEACYEEILKSKKGKKRLHLPQTLNKSSKAWKKSWAEELACDMIATYLVGPAYAWANLKICSVNSGLNKIYSHIREHPPDEARMRGILKMLALSECTEDIPVIEEAWNRFLSVTQNDKSEKYDDIFCDELIESIASNVHIVCQDNALLGYKQQRQKHTRPVSAVINDAWDKIRNEPEKYAEWEEGEIENLQSRMLQPY